MRRELVESRMRGNTHVRFGGRAGETDQPEGWYRAPARPYSQIQALDRTQPLLPMRPGQPERRTHDYVRHGTATLFAAFDIASGSVTGRTYTRHRHQEFLKFLQVIDARYPGVDIHLVLDNYRTHKHPVVTAWLAEHPRFQLHFTPTSASWMNQVETWFSPSSIARQFSAACSAASGL